MNAYKHLGIEEGHNIDHKEGKGKLKQYEIRLRLILSTAKRKIKIIQNKMQAIGLLARPVLRNSFGINSYHE